MIALGKRQFGNLSGLPDRPSSAALVEEARRLKDEIEPVRAEMVTVLIAKARSFWCGCDDEIIAAAYSNPSDYWESHLAEPMTAASFAHFLSVHLIDPAEQLNNPFDRRSVVKRHLHKALRLAMQARERFFISDGALDQALIRPREAALWLLSLPKRRDLVAPGLRAYLLPTSAPSIVIEHEPQPIAASLNVQKVDTDRDCEEWVQGFLEKRKQYPDRNKFREWASDHGIPQSRAEELRAKFIPEKVRKGGRGANKIKPAE